MEIITGGEPGGAQRHVAHLVRYLSNQGATVTVVHGGGHWLGQAVGDAADVVYVPELVRRVRWRSDYQATKKLARILRERRPQVVHCHSSKAGALVRWVAWRMGVPAVYTAHGLVFHDPKHSWASRALYRVIESWGARHAKAVVVMTPEDMAFVQKAKGRAVFIVNGVEEPKTARRRRPGPPAIGFLGRFSPEKGLDWLLPLAGRQSQWQWRLAGAGPQEVLVREAVKRWPHIQWMGWIGEDDQNFWDTIDVLVQPSWKEGAPYSVLEAMARGVPVVGSRVGALPAMISPVDPALVVTPGEPDALRQALAFALDHAEELGIRAREVVQQEFSMANQHQKTWALLQEVARA